MLEKRVPRILLEQISTATPFPNFTLTIYGIKVSVLTRIKKEEWANSYILKCILMSVQVWENILGP